MEQKNVTSCTSLHYFYLHKCQAGMIALDQNIVMHKAVLGSTTYGNEEIYYLIFNQDEPVIIFITKMTYQH
jgi:hypothetical protein